jgi:hypothetical protein
VHCLHKLSRYSRYLQRRRCTSQLPIRDVPQVSKSLQQRHTFHYSATPPMTNVPRSILPKPSQAGRTTKSSGVSKEATPMPKRLNSVRVACNRCRDKKTVVSDMPQTKPLCYARPQADEYCDLVHWRAPNVPQLPKTQCSVRVYHEESRTNTGHGYS